MDGYSVYILRCNDQTLYTGIAKDIKKRLDEHNNSKLGVKYTRGRRPVKLVYSKNFKNRSLALKQESKIKKFSRQDKLKLITKNTKNKKHLNNNNKNSSKKLDKQ